MPSGWAPHWGWPSRSAWGCCWAGGMPSPPWWGRAHPWAEAGSTGRECCSPQVRHWGKAWLSPAAVVAGSGWDLGTAWASHWEPCSASAWASGSAQPRETRIRPGWAWVRRHPRPSSPHNPPATGAAGPKPRDSSSLVLQSRPPEQAPRKSCLLVGIVIAGLNRLQPGPACLEQARGDHLQLCPATADTARPSGMGATVRALPFPYKRKNGGTARLLDVLHLNIYL